MKLLFMALLLGIFSASIVYANESEEGSVIWRFCDEEKQFNYEIVNGTIHDTVHLKLFETDHCKDKTNLTDYQFQIFYRATNHTDFTLIVPEEIEIDTIDVRVVGDDHLEFFQLNDTKRILKFSDFIPDKNGFVTIIMDHNSNPE